MATRKSRRLSKRSRAVVAILVVAILCIGVAINLIAEHRAMVNNQKVFDTLSLQTKNLFAQHATALGLDGSSPKFSKTCYYTEQTEWNKGRLWCGVGIKRSVELPVSLQTAVAKFSEIVKSEGFTVETPASISLSQSFVVVARKSTGPYPSYCSAELDYAQGQPGSLSYSLACSDRARDIPHGFTYDPS